MYSICRASDAWPYQSLAQRDLVVIRNVAMFFAALVIVVNFVVDLAYLWLDPRLRTA